MLTHDAAEKRLRAFKIPGWEKKRLADLGELPPALTMRFASASSLTWSMIMFRSVPQRAGARLHGQGRQIANHSGGVQSFGIFTAAIRNGCARRQVHQESTGLRRR